MKEKTKEIGLIILMTMIILLFVVISVITFIIPGFNDISKSNKINYISKQEQNLKEEAIIKKYDNLEIELNNKYAKLELEIEEKYNNLETEINVKYAELEEKIVIKYDELEQVITDKYNKLKKQIKAKYTKKMGEAGWFEQQVAMNGEINALVMPEINEKQINSKAESNEKSNNKKAEINEKNTNDSLKKNELKNLNIEKSNNFNLLIKQEKDEISKTALLNKEKALIMTTGIFKLMIGLSIIAIIFSYIILMFNKLIHLKNLVKEKWSVIEVLLKRRINLIPNVVETIKGYSDYEKDTLESIIEARNKIAQSNSKTEEISNQIELTNRVNSLLAIVEDYPNLKANISFINLQEELKKTENEIAEARIVYNNAVLLYKNKIEMFPSNIMAEICNFKVEPFYEANENDKKNIDIKF